MMKNKILGLFSLLTATLVVTSCTNNGDEVAPIVQVAKPTMTINFPTTTTVVEGTSIPITFTLSAPVGKEFNVYVVLDQQGSTADGADSDVENQSVNTTFQKVIVIPPFVTTYSDVITINEDELAEGTETLKLNVGETRTSAVIFQPVVSTILITNKISDDLVLEFNFDKKFTGASGCISTLCTTKSTVSLPLNKPYDIDFIVYDGAFTPVSFNGSAGAQTGACKEKLTMNLADYPDDLYHITAYLYTDADLYATGASQFNIPITVDYLRAGSINKATYTQEPANFLNSNSPEGTELQVVDILISTVDGVRKFTIQNTAGVISASGKMATKGKTISRHQN